MCVWVCVGGVGVCGGVGCVWVWGVCVCGVGVYVGVWVCVCVYGCVWVCVGVWGWVCLCLAVLGGNSVWFPITSDLLDWHVCYYKFAFLCWMC